MTKDEIIRMAREIAEYLRDCAGSPVMAAKCDSLCEQIALVAENTGIEQQREIVRLKGIIEEQANGAQNLVAAHEREKQAEQEPVAWISSICPKCKNKVKGAPDSGWVWRCPKCAFEWPVDNAAPVRTKDLTDDEIAEACGWKFGQPMYEWVIGLSRAVIAADREKNNV